MKIVKKNEHSVLLKSFGLKGARFFKVFLRSCNLEGQVDLVVNGGGFNLAANAEQVHLG